jgi:hypothetical protein
MIRHYPIDNLSSFEFTLNSLGASAEVQSTGQGVFEAFVFTIILPIEISILTEDSIELMGSIANIIKLIFNLGLLDFNNSANPMLYLFSWNSQVPQSNFMTIILPSTRANNINGTLQRLVESQKNPRIFLSY